MGQVIASIAAFFSGEVLSFGGAEAARFLRGGIVFVQRRAGSAAPRRRFGLQVSLVLVALCDERALRERCCAAGRRAVGDAGVPMGVPGAQRVPCCYYR